MSKPVKQAMMREYVSRLSVDAQGTKSADGATGGEALTDALLISIRGLKGTDNTKMRLGLAKKKIKVQVVRNALARKTIGDSTLKPLIDLLSGPSAMVFGGTSTVEVAREIVALMAQFPAIELKGAVLDGTLFSGKAGVIELSKFPTKDEAIAKVVTLVVSPGRKVLGQIKGPGAKVAGIIMAIEGKLEKGEAIAKAG